MTFKETLAKAHAEGKAEGAEQMKETIRNNSLHYRQFDKMEPNIVAGEHNDYAFAQENLFVVLASVLAPTKESEK